MDPQGRLLMLGSGSQRQAIFIQRIPPVCHNYTKDLSNGLTGFRKGFRVMGVRVPGVGFRI